MAYYRTVTSKVHTDRECLEYMTDNEIYELFDGELLVGELCQRCTPARRSIHLKCRRCGHRKIQPCPHNGAVRVEHEDVIVWTWPEDVVPGTLVNPVEVR